MSTRNSGTGASSASVAAVKVDTAATVADLANATDGLGALKAGIDAIPTTMVGTDLAYLASVATTANEFAAHIQRHCGEIFYVNKDGDDANDGSTPHLAKLTIQDAIDSAAAGDAISVKAGTYAESVDMDEVGLELWPEIGTIIAPASGTPLTVSANFCKIWCPGGSLKVMPAANETGVAVTGQFCYLSDIRVTCDSSADIGFFIGSAADNTEGDGCVLNNCRCASPLIAAFKLQADKLNLGTCCTGGDSGDSSIGFWALPDASGAIDKLRLKNCGSQGHETAGYQIDAGCANGAIEGCYSGGGDGRWIDNGTDFTWPNFKFDDKVTHRVTFDGSGGASVNLFEIVGAVQIVELYGRVDTVLAADVGTVYLELYDGTNSLDVTDSPGPDFSSLPVGTYAHKIDDAGVNINVLDSSQVRLYEDATKDGRDPTFQVVGKEGVTSYLRMVYSGVGTSGAIHWHCTWRPLSDEGFMNSV